MRELAKSSPKLEDFPPKLRNLGRFIINSGQLMTLKEACEATSINYQTVRTQILRSKKKGLDFHRLVDDHVIEKLRNARPEVYKSLQERAISGSLGHQKLFSEIVGDIKDKLEIDHKLTGLHYVYAPSSKLEDMPEGIKKIREKTKPDGIQIIDADMDD